MLTSAVMPIDGPSLPELHARSERYRRFAADPRIACRTSFFAAAHVVTRVLARGPVTTFIAELSARLEIVNAERAQLVRSRKLYADGGILSNTADFIRFEQRCVQAALDRLRAASYFQYCEEIGRMNWNMRRAALWPSRLLSPAHAAMCRAILASRAALGSWPDFSRQFHRETVGLQVAGSHRRALP